MLLTFRPLSVYALHPPYISHGVVMSAHFLHTKTNEAFELLAQSAIAACEAIQCINDTYEAIYQAERERNALRAGEQWQSLNNHWTNRSRK